MPPSFRAFVIEVMLHDDRWHGQSEWPPSPFRLFQALVAAAARGCKLEAADERALQWLEALDPPVIVAPRLWRRGQQVQTYVPNNDLDAVGGNPDLMEKVRAPKRIQPCLLQDSPRFLYIWSFEMENGVHAPSQRLMHIARRLYQLGRGMDMAWARAHILTPQEAEMQARNHGGVWHEPCSAGDNMLAVPIQGSLRSLQHRFDAFRKRLQGVKKGRRSLWHFRQPPKPLRRVVGYACSPQRWLFDIRKLDAPEAFAPRPQRHVAPLVKRLRDMAAKRLRDAGAEAGLVERFLIGRNADAQDKKKRVRIIPLPSIGHEFAGGAIRRVLVEVPGECPLSAEDVQWAFTGECFDAESGELVGQLLVPAPEQSMLRRYGVGEKHAAMHWRSVTPAVLPVSRHGKTGSERLRVERQVVRAVRTALRHAGVRVPVARVHVQREPFDRNSFRADEYMSDRFKPRQLWHVDILFAEPVSGPLVIGNGRYLGLGLLAPVSQRDACQQAIHLSGVPDEVARGACIFALPGDGLPAGQRELLLKTVRAALMRIDADMHGDKPCSLFSGHPEEEAKALREGHHAHVFLAAPSDRAGRIRHLYVIAPWLADRSAGAQELRRQERWHFSEVVSRLEVLYAQGLPRQPLVPLSAGERDCVLGMARTWVNVTPYISTRHPKGAQQDDLAAFVQEDVQRELARRQLTAMQVEVLAVEQGPNGGLRARCCLHSDTALPGPLLLGRGSHRGWGCFVLANNHDGGAAC